MDPDVYKRAHEYGATYWWYVARLDIIKAVFDKLVLPQCTNELQILNIGLGGSNISTNFARYGRIYSIDCSSQALRFGQLEGQRCLAQTDAGMLPFKNDYFDVIFLCDVLEHVDDEISVLRESRRVLKNAGVVITTVPAYKFMWSKMDSLGCHKRRYLGSELSDKMGRSGFSKIKLTYFNTFLFPAALIQRYIEKTLHIDRRGDSFLPILPAWINKVLTMIFSSEKYFLMNFTFPFGLSILGIYKK